MCSQNLNNMIKKANKLICINKGEISMGNFKDFLTKNNEKIRRIVSGNTVVNSNGTIVITKNDIWRKETEWDAMYTYPY